MIDKVFNINCRFQIFELYSNISKATKNISDNLKRGITIKI